MFPKPFILLFFMFDVNRKSFWLFLEPLHLRLVNTWRHDSDCLFPKLGPFPKPKSCLNKYLNTRGSEERERVPAIVENTSYIYTSIYFCLNLVVQSDSKVQTYISRGVPLPLELHLRNLGPVNPVLNHVACLTVSSGGLVHLNAAMSTCLMDIIVYFTVPSTSSHQSGEHPQQWYPSINAGAWSPRFLCSFISGL